MTRTTPQLACAAVFALMAFAWSIPARAELQIVFQSINLGTQINGADAWRYDYTVAGREFTAGEAFEIYFPLTLYRDLNPLPAPDGWSTFVLVATVPGDFDDSGFAAIADQDDAGPARSFSVEFGWIGKGVPGAQRFDLFDPDFNTLASGETMNTPAIPEPASALVLLAGLALLWLRATRSPRGVRK